MKKEEIIYLAHGHKDPTYEILEKKICGYPHTKERGLKSFP